MTVETDADRLIFIQDFGITVTAIIALQKVTFLAIFDNGYDEIFETEGANPSITARDADTGLITNGQEISVPVSGTDTDYTVVNSQPDGTGITTFYLHTS